MTAILVKQLKQARKCPQYEPVIAAEIVITIFASLFFLQHLYLFHTFDKV